MKPIPKNAALVLIDIQQGFDRPGYWGVRNNPEAEANAARLLDAWRTSGRPLFHVRHLSRNPKSPLAPGQPGCEIKPQVEPRPGEAVIGKDVNSAFIGTDFEARLRAAGIDTLVLAGLTTPHCVSTTARMAGNLGFRTLVAADACAAFSQAGYDGREFGAEIVHQVALANLNGEFAEVVESTDILGNLEA
ncbi:MAG: cysteine hydrolase family protein [Bacillota bacterium]